MAKKRNRNGLTTEESFNVGFLAGIVSLLLFGIIGLFTIDLRDTEAIVIGICLAVMIALLVGCYVFLKLDKGESNNKNCNDDIVTKINMEINI